MMSDTSDDELSPDIDPCELTLAVDLMPVGAAVRQAELDRRVGEVRRDVGPRVLPLPD